MPTVHRLLGGIVVVALASLWWEAPRAAAALEPQDLSALGQLLKGLVAKQVFTGTVVVSDVASGTSSSDDGVIGGSTSAVSLNHNVVFTVTPGSVVAKITYEEKTRVDTELRYQYHKVVGYKTTETTASGTNSDVATVNVSVDLRSDDTYQIAFRTDGVQGEYRMFDTAETICTNLGADPTCRPGTSSSNDSGTPPNQGGLAGSVDGRRDAKQPNTLVGSATEPLELGDGIVGKRTVTWNLSRQP